MHATPLPTLLATLPLLLTTASLALASPLELASPNGNVVLRLAPNPAGHLTYSVTASGQPRLLPAPTGLVVDQRNLGAHPEIGPPTRRTISETFPWRGPKNRGTNHCEAYLVPIRHRDLQEPWHLEARLFDDGAAFRFRIPSSGHHRVTGESTQWQFPPDTTLWLQTNTGDYEGDYHPRAADQVPLEQTIQNRPHPTHLGLPVTAVYPDRTLGLITEANLFRFSGVSLRPLGNSSFQATFQDDPAGWDHDGPILTPWRVAILAPNLHALVNSDVVAALCDPPDPALFPQGLETPWIQPGKAPCTWMVFGNDGAQWDRQKWFVDVSAAIGCEYLLVDAGWRTERWGWLKDGADVWARAAELCRYAAQRNVGIILWHAYPEGRDDGPGLTNPQAREELFRRCQEAGVKGVKIDFFNSESRATIDAYEDLLRRAAQHQLLVNFHGANKPTGEARTWPNEITREGIREQEYLLWGTLPLPHYGALPFTRLAVGHADFLPGYLQSRFLKNTTRTFQLASVVLFSSPFLCWPDNPEAYLHSPFLDFVRTVPVAWDETRVLPGSSIGETVIFARRKDQTWYLAAINCLNHAQSLEFDLAPLQVTRHELTTFRDGPGPSGVLLESGLSTPASNRLTAQIPPGGGFLARFTPTREFPGWK